MVGGLTLDELNERVERHGELVAGGKTVRAVAKETGWSKTTVDVDVAVRLLNVNPELAEEARKVLDQNYSERSIRGGRASQAKKRMQF